MLTIIMKRYPDGKIYYQEGIQNGYSKTVILGGKEIVKRTRYWTHKGGGNWVTEWYVNEKDIDKCIASVKYFGYNIEIINCKSLEEK